MLLSDNRWFRALDPAQTVVFTGTVTEGGNNAFQRNIYKGGRGTVVFEGPVDLTGSKALYIYARRRHRGPAQERGLHRAPRPTCPTRSTAQVMEVNTGGTLVLDNSLPGYNLTDRLADTSDVRLYGGTLKFIGANGAASSRERRLPGRVGSGPGQRHLPGGHRRRLVGQADHQLPEPPERQRRRRHARASSA